MAWYAGLCEQHCCRHHLPLPPTFNIFRTQAGQRLTDRWQKRGDLANKETLHTFLPGCSEAWYCGKEISGVAEWPVLALREVIVM